ncbi:hypothetical protein GCM10023080_035320 [Streptomyces pseudoechinosporeus]
MPPGILGGLLHLVVPIGVLLAAWRLTPLFVRPLHRLFPDEPEPSWRTEARFGDGTTAPSAADEAEEPFRGAPYAAAFDSRPRAAVQRGRSSAAPIGCLPRRGRRALKDVGCLPAQCAEFAQRLGHLRSGLQLPPQLVEGVGDVRAVLEPSYRDVQVPQAGCPRRRRGLRDACPQASSERPNSSA